MLKILLMPQIQSNSAGAYFFNRDVHVLEGRTLICKTVWIYFGSLPRPQVYILHNYNYIICYEWNRTWHLGPVPRKHLSQDQPLKEKKEATTFIIVCTWIMPPSHSSNISFPLHKRVYRFIDPSKAEPGWKVDVWKTILSFEAFAFQLPREFFSWFSCLQRSWESHMVSSTGLAHISRLRRAAISLNSVDSINTSHMIFMDFSWIMYPQQAG